MKNASRPACQNDVHQQHRSTSSFLIIGLAWESANNDKPGFSKIRTVQCCQQICLEDCAALYVVELMLFGLSMSLGTDAVLHWKEARNNDSPRRASTTAPPTAIPAMAPPESDEPLDFELAAFEAAEPA